MTAGVGEYVTLPAPRLRELDAAAERRAIDDGSSVVRSARPVTVCLCAVHQTRLPGERCDRCGWTLVPRREA